MSISEITLVGSAAEVAQAISTAGLRRCLVDGLRNLGVTVTLGALGNVSTKHVACWGWRNGKIFREKGHEVLVMERGYIGDRFYYSSLGWNGLNGHARFPDYPPDDGKRFREHGGIIRPWKTDGEYVLILGQVKGDASLQGKDIMGFYEQKANEIRKHYGVEVYYRPHPDSARRPGYRSVPGVPNISGDFGSVVNKALFTVAFNSNACVDSVMEGIPCYAGDAGTMAYDLCFKNITKIERPDREKRLHQIAWTQWNPEEIQSGEALVAMIK